MPSISLKSDIIEIAEIVAVASQKAHDLSEGLSPSSLQAGGIETALSELAQKMENLFDCTCTFSCSPVIPEMNRLTATHLYRIAQEAVTNAIRHGKASFITISLQKIKKQIRLIITDNGIGIPEKALRKSGMGLRIMHYRSRIIDAILEVKPDSNKGTIVTCTLRNV